MRSQINPSDTKPEAIKKLLFGGLDYFIFLTTSELRTATLKRSIAKVTTAVDVARFKKKKE
jgi:hypothetical protein